MAFRKLFRQIIFLEKPGYAKITEGFHDLSVDCMNTSFSLVSDKDKRKLHSALKEFLNVIHL